MKNFIKKNAIISMVIVLILVGLVVSLFIDVSFAGTPIESTDMIASVDLSNGSVFRYMYVEGLATIYEGAEPMGTLKNSREISIPQEIEWPKRAYCSLCRDDVYYISTLGYVIRIYSDGIDVYDKNTGEVKEIWTADHIQMSLLVTEKEICFSSWEVDVANWRRREKTDGTYKYTFETGKLEKISSSAYWNLKVKNSRVLVSEKFGILPHIVIIF